MCLMWTSLLTAQWEGGAGMPYARPYPLLPLPHAPTVTAFLELELINSRLLEPVWVFESLSGTKYSPRAC